MTEICYNNYMKKILKSPKIVVYENVKKVTDILDIYVDMEDIDVEEIAKEILETFGIDKGKMTVIELFQNNVEAILEDGKITL